MTTELRDSLSVFADYVARAAADEHEDEPLVTALYQFGRDLGPSQRRDVEQTLANYVLAGWVEAGPQEEPRGD